MKLRRQLNSVFMLGGVFLTLEILGCKAPSSDTPAAALAQTKSSPSASEAPRNDIMVNMYIAAADMPKYEPALRNIDTADDTQGIILKVKGTVTAASDKKLALGSSWRWFDEGAPVPTRVGSATSDAVDSIDARRILTTPDGKFVPPYSIVPEGATVYRGMDIDGRQLDNILDSGIDSPVAFFHSKNANAAERPVTASILAHQDDPTFSVFVSTSQNLNKAATFVSLQGDGIVFEISVPANKGISVNEALGKDSLYTNENEVVIVGKVEPETITGYFIVKNKKIVKYICLLDCE